MVVSKSIFLLFCLIFISGCQFFAKKNELKNIYLQDSGFTPIAFDSISFNLEAWKIFASDKETLVIYIEGDGRAWKTRFKLSTDPSPDDPLALKLSTLDNADSILYLARPCQFRSKADVKCQNSYKYWSSHRYSEEVLMVYNQILNQLKKQYGFKQFQLIGYSGGGVVASLLAAIRSDVVSLITISSNLDHQSWVDYHQVSPLSGSLTLYQHLQGLSQVRQFHLWGSNDKLVPAQLNSGLIKKLQLLHQDNVSMFIIDQYSHHCCWKENWSKILSVLRDKKIGEIHGFFK